MQLEDELNRAKCILVDGDASYFLVGKVESACILFSHFGSSLVANVW